MIGAYIYVSFLPNWYGLSLEFILRWLALFIALRFAFLIVHILLLKPIKKAELIVRIIYSAFSFIVFIFYLFLAIQYHPIGDALFLIIFSCIICPSILIGFECGIVASRTKS